jgi:hypothetical protein
MMGGRREHGRLAVGCLAHHRDATFWNGLGVSDDEEGVHVFLATGLRSSWAQAWPAFRDYS